MEQDLQELCERVVASWKANLNSGSLEAYLDDALTFQLDRLLRSTAQAHIEKAVAAVVAPVLQSKTTEIENVAAALYEEWQAKELKPLVRGMAKEAMRAGVEKKVNASVSSSLSTAGELVRVLAREALSRWIRRRDVSVIGPDDATRKKVNSVLSNLNMDREASDFLADALRLHKDGRSMEEIAVAMNLNAQDVPGVIASAAARVAELSRQLGYFNA